MLMNSHLGPRTPSLAIYAALLLTTFIAPAAAEDTANGSALFAENCAVCHGAHGEISNEVVPNILGQYPGYLLTQMQAFLSDDPRAARAGVAGSLKRSILLDLSVDDIRDIVSWLGTIEYKVVGASKKEAEARGELAAAGRPCYDGSVHKGLFMRIWS